MLSIHPLPRPIRRVFSTRILFVIGPAVVVCDRAVGGLFDCEEVVSLTLRCVVPCDGDECSWSLVDVMKQTVVRTFRCNNPADAEEQMEAVKKAM